MTLIQAFCQPGLSWKMRRVMASILWQSFWRRVVRWRPTWYVMWKLKRDMMALTIVMERMHAKHMADRRARFLMDAQNDNQH